MNRLFYFPSLVIFSVITLVLIMGVAYPDIGKNFPLTINASLVGKFILSTGAMILAALSMVPAEAIAISNGMMFGPLIGFALTWAGALIGASLAFLLAKLMGRKIIGQLLSEHHMSQLDRWFEQYGLLLFFIARLIPFVPFFALNYGAGLTNMKFGDYLAVTGIGILPMTILCVTLGDRIMESDWQAFLAIASIMVFVTGLVLWAKRQYRTE